MKLEINIIGLHDHSQWDQWGILTKRMAIDLTGDGKPELIGKSRERFSEIVNITATIERLLSGITYFSTQTDYAHLQIKECHPSTSDTDSGNDLVLVDKQGNIKVRCEVCDIVSQNTGFL